MSSPMPVGALAPAPYSDAGYESQGRGSMTPTAAMLRPMRLKVLYTFDEQSKVNCLARWPHIVNVQTVDLDEATCIGVVELKTCIQAIVSASPELVAKLGQDYTVYAFDYSEQDTPLVGQGMLSWALASPGGAATPRSRAIITGRVSRSVLGIFSNGVTETLEVKLRLVPVPACQQSEFINSMDRYRELSKVMPTEFDAAAWSSFLQENPGAAELADKLKTSSHTRQDSQSHGAAGLEALSQLMHEGLPTTSPAPQDVSMSADLTWSGHNVASPYDVTSRIGSPYQVTPTAVGYHNYPQTGPSRLVSQGSSRSTNLLQQSSADSAPQLHSPSGDVLSSTHADGPARKRARTTKADWSGRFSMGLTPESLRVTASTAASIRTFRPAAVRPSTSEGTNLEEPPRQPTPVPEAAGAKPRRVRPITRSGLRQESYYTQAASSEPASPTFTHFTNHGHFPGLPVEDPRSNGMIGSPAEMASSPPVMDQPSPVPSSPALPMLPPPIDSGFMSGPAEDLEGGDEMRGVADELELTDGPTQPAMVAPVGMPLRIEQVTPGPYELLPTRILPRTVRRKNKSGSAVPSETGEPLTEAPQLVAPKPRRAIKANLQQVVSTTEVEPEVATATVSNRIVPPSRRISCTPSMGSATSPPVTAHEPVVSVTDTTFAQATVEKPTQLRSGSGAKRKKAIQRRLQTAIGNGEMPPFCQNCGAIETPTWRKAWSKKLEGTSLNVQVSTEEGGVIAIKDIVKDSEGNVTSVSILKKTLLATDEGFREVQLCNPCGLWLQKFKCMRPEERWNKEAKDPSGRKKPSKKRKQPAETVAGEIPNASVPEAINQGDGTGSPQEASDDAAAEQGKDDAADGQMVRQATRAVSLQPRADHAAEEDGQRRDEGIVVPRRETQSSPSRGLGTACSPIDLDYWGSTRRVLFPSPNKSEGGGCRALKDITLADEQQQVHQQKNDHEIPGKPSLTHRDSTTSNKENVIPGASEQQQQQEYDLADLFEESAGEEFKTPKTPPQRTPRSDRVLRSSTRSALCEKINGVMVSPSKSAVSSRSRCRGGLLRTPTSSSRHAKCKSKSKSRSPRSSSKMVVSPRQQQIMTPFTAQMYQMLCDGNFSPSRHGHHHHHHHLDLDNHDHHDGHLMSMSMTTFEEDFMFPNLPDSTGLGMNSPNRHFSSMFNLSNFVDGGGVVSTTDVTTTTSTAGVHLEEGIENEKERRKRTDVNSNNNNTSELSTDIIIPPHSSPPNFFALYEDPVESTGGLWSGFDLSKRGGGRVLLQNEEMEEVEEMHGQGNEDEEEEEGGRRMSNRMKKSDDDDEEKNKGGGRIVLGEIDALI